jgi:hypothetical protein
MIPLTDPVLSGDLFWWKYTVKKIIMNCYRSWQGEEYQTVVSPVYVKMDLIKDISDWKIYEA